MTLTVNNSFLGARASNAGDAFHEIWALRKALELLDPETGLVLLTLEGVGNLSKTTDNRQWDGVDCALYYGETEDGPFDRVNLVQLRYSAAAPNNGWALGQFTKTSSKNNNSLARRLATAFNEATKGMSFDEIRRKIDVSLVTNQPVSPSLEKLVKQISDGTTNSPNAEKLSKATALSKTKLKLFCERLTLKGSEKSRADLNADVVHKIYEMIDTDVVSTLAGLKIKIGEQMLPEGRGSHGITRATVESWFNVGQTTALFPCEARLEKIENPINRDVSVALADAVKNHDLACFHGGGGHGKSTVAQELESLLPSGSKVILYDCYGAGTYRDPSRYRHRPLEAFTQLSNELALTVRAPCLFPHRDNPDIIRSFRRRLELASELIETETPEALLVILIDAADNAVAASMTPEPTDRCFVHDLVQMSELPGNARILISARTSRRGSLNLPPGCKTILCPPFSEKETRQMVARQFPDPPDQLVEDFHYLSNGNPRVQSSALASCECFEDAVESLRPTGKSDSDIYKEIEIVDKAILRAGVHIDTDLFCSALSVLPSPAPIEFIASVCEMSEPAVAELCEELIPNLRVTPRGVEFANEDFENFCEEFGSPHVDNVRQLCAEKFLEKRFDSEYAAIHLFNILSKTGHSDKLFNLLREKDSTRAIADPFVRRLTDLARLRAAVSVASQHDDVVEAAKTILVGSDALSTNSKITEIMVGNLDLSACFFEDTIRQLVLNNPDEWMRQGSLLAHLAKEYALAGHALKSRGAIRNVREWYHARTSREKRRQLLKKGDFIAKVIGIYKNEGWKAVEKYCEGFKSKLWSISMKHELLKYIALSEGSDAVRNIRPKMNRQQRWIASVFAKRCGSEISAKELSNDCKALARFDFSCLKPDNSESLLLIDDLLFFAELCKRSGVAKELVAELSGKIWPRENRKIERISTEYHHTDFSYRAALLETFDADFALDTEKIFQIPQKPDNYSRDPDARRNWSVLEDRIKEIKLTLPFYEALVNANAARTENDLDASLHSLLALRENSSLSLHTWKFFPVAEIMARRIVDFNAMNGMMTIDRTLDTIDRLIPENNPFFAIRLSGSLQLLMCNQMFFDKVVAVLQKYAGASEDYTLLATEKAELMVGISRLLLPVNRDEAKVYFKRALEIVEEIDFELIEKLYCITKMANRFSGDNPENRKRCESLAKLVRRAGIILGDEKYFPYRESVEAMLSLSAPVAACVFSRWTDEGFLSSNGYFLQEALKRKALPETHLTALSLITEESPILMKEVCGNATNLPEDMRHAILDEFAKLELMELAPGSTEPMNESLKRLADNCDKAPEAFRQLSHTHEFLKDKGIETARDDITGTETGARKGTIPDCTGVDVCDHESILATMHANRDAGCRDSEVFYSELRKHVRPEDRIRHLDAVASIAKFERFPESEISHIISCLDTWPGNAVKQWAETTIPLLIIELGPKIMGYSLLEEGSFPSLVRASNISNESLKCTLVTAVKRNAQKTRLWGLLKYAAALVNVLSEEQAGEVFDWYVSELNGQINVQEKSGDRHDIPLNDLPETPDEITASLLYRFLGDVDVRIRWRAAHSVRAFVRMGRNEVVRNLIRRALSPKPFAYVFGDIPIHELTARLFLAITLARVAFEAPKSIAPLGKDILRLATDGPPHVLIAHHVKRALTRLLDTEKMDSVGADEVKSLASPARGHVQPPGRSKIRSFDHRTDQDHVRFRFDPMDTLPYWYSSALEIFTDVSPEDFLAQADYWIVDQWGAEEDCWRWDREPRRDRFEGRGGSLGRHGSSYPDMESHPRYLEWHAMFVVVGELIKTHPVVMDEEERNNFELWIERWDTTYQGTWLSDLREPVPLEPRYWGQPQKDDPAWLETMDEKKLHAELFTEKPGELVLLSYRETIQYYIGDRAAEQKVKVKSALVPPNTAPSLVRMFQAMEDPMYILLPDNNDSMNNEKRIEGFVMRPTAVVHRMYRDSGFDSSDPTRYSIIGVNWVPADDLVKSLGLVRPSPWSRIWHSKQSGADTCRYESWSTQRNDDHHLWSRSRSDTATDGIRLTIHTESVLQALKELNHDLLVKVEITNSTGDDYARNLEENKKEVCSFRVYLLRQDGTIEHADGNVGVWFPDR